MEILKISALGNLRVREGHEINYSLVLIARNLQPTQDEVFHVGS